MVCIEETIWQTTLRMPLIRWYYSSDATGHSASRSTSSRLPCISPSNITLLIPPSVCCRPLTCHCHCYCHCYDTTVNSPIPCAVARTIIVIVSDWLRPTSARFHWYIRADHLSSFMAPLWSGRVSHGVATGRWLLAANCWLSLLPALPCPGLLPLLSPHDPRFLRPTSLAWLITLTVSGCYRMVEGSLSSLIHTHLWLITILVGTVYCMPSLYPIHTRYSLL